MELDHERFLLGIRMAERDRLDPNVQRRRPWGGFTGIPQNIDERFDQLLPIRPDRRVRLGVVFNQVQLFLSRHLADIHDRFAYEVGRIVRSGQVHFHGCQ